MWYGRWAACGSPGVCTVVALDPASQRGKLETFSRYTTQVAATEKGAVRAVSHPERIRFEVFFSRSAW
jgi:hypothetical protein